MRKICGAVISRVREFSTTGLKVSTGIIAHTNPRIYKLGLWWNKTRGPKLPPRIQNITIKSIIIHTTLQWKFEPVLATGSIDILEIAKTWPHYGLNKSTLRSNLLFSIHISGSKDIVEMAKTWPQYGPNKSTLRSILLFGMHASLL